MYRLIVESLLGLVTEANTLRFVPCLPPEWEGCTIHYRHLDTVYHIRMLQNVGENAVMRVTVDGIEQPESIVPLVNDRREHAVEVRFSSTADDSNPSGGALG